MLERFYARARATFGIVNGVPVVPDTRITGARPGRPLRRGGG